MTGQDLTSHYFLEFSVCLPPDFRLSDKVYSNNFEILNFEQPRPCLCTGQFRVLMLRAQGPYYLFLRNYPGRPRLDLCSRSVREDREISLTGILRCRTAHLECLTGHMECCTGHVIYSNGRAACISDRAACLYGRVVCKNFAQFFKKGVPYL